jgi:broad specificity phosphatase PhoE
MTIIRSCLLGALAILSVGMATGSPATPPAVFVMRHLNTPAGARDPDLTADGRRNAERLAGWFQTVRPNVIFISDFRRTRQTVGPLATRLGLTPILYDPADTPALIARVRAARGRVLIVGHSNTVPDIIGALGGARPAPLGHEDFGDIWTVRRNGTTVHNRVDDPRQ